MAWFCMIFCEFLVVFLVWHLIAALVGLIAYKFRGNVIILRGSSPYSLQLIVLWPHNTKSYYQSIVLYYQFKQWTWSDPINSLTNIPMVTRFGSPQTLCVPFLLSLITYNYSFIIVRVENLTWVPVQPTQHHYVTESGANAPQTAHTVLTIWLTKILTVEYQHHPTWCTVSINKPLSIRLFS